MRVTLGLKPLVTSCAFWVCCGVRNKPLLSNSRFSSKAVLQFVSGNGTNPYLSAFKAGPRQWKQCLQILRGYSWNLSTSGSPHNGFKEGSSSSIIERCVCASFCYEVLNCLLDFFHSFVYDTLMLTLERGGTFYLRSCFNCFGLSVANACLHPVECALALQDGQRYPYQFAPTGNCTFEADFAVAVLLHLVKHPIPQPAVWYL